MLTDYASEIAESLDWARSRVLRKTLAYPTLRKAFLTRSHRLFLFFILTTLFALLSSLFVPLWSLLLGPLLYGVPHLYSSLRYVHHALIPRSLNESAKATAGKGHTLFLFLTLTFTLVTTLRLWMHFHSITLEALPLGDLLPEWLSYGVTCLGLSWIYRHSWRELAPGLTLTLCLLVLAWRFPLEIAGLLMLAHHFIGFLFWIHFSRKDAADFKIALLCSLLFCFLHVLIFLGVFDPLYALYSPSGEIAWANLEYSQIGALVLPHATEYTTLFHATTAYAFGQTLHYFLWLKAIPDQHHYHTTPTTFRQSLTLLLKDFRSPFLILGAVATGSLWMIWILWNYPMVRTLYFILASYHGFMELAALGLLRRTPS